MKKKKLILLALAIICIIATVVTLIILYSSHKIEPGIFEKAIDTAFSPTQTAAVQIREIMEWHKAIGTVRPLTEAKIQARISGQVLDVKVNPGAKVTKGQLLATLDNRQLLAKLDQVKQTQKAAEAKNKGAHQGIAAAEAAFDQAQSAYKRVKSYFESEAATAADLEKAESVYLQAKAELSRTKEALSGTGAGIKQALEVMRETEILLDYAKIRAPEAGTILKRLVESGDMALPGKSLFILRTSTLLRLEAHVREGLIHKTEIGQALQVSIDSLNETVDAKIEEIIPYADPQTRTFLVKASLPQIEGLYPGMFGKLLIPDRKQKVILIPPAAIYKVGQLELVRVKRDEGWRKQLIKSGKNISDMVEVLSGLNGNETVGWGEAQND